MKTIGLAILMLSLAFHAMGLEKSGVISTDETWRGVVNVTGDIATSAGADITVVAGTRIAFDGDYNIKINTNSILSIEGTSGAPVIVDAGQHLGGIHVKGGRGVIRYVRFRNIGLGGSFVQMLPPLLQLEDSVLVGGSVSTYHGEIVFRRNLIKGAARNNFVGDHSKAEITDNIFVGGTWVTKSLGGVVSGNVFVSEPVPPGAKQDDYTHEHVLGIKPAARIERNILVGRSHAALMSIGVDNADGAVIRNNTIDMRGTGAGLMFHMADPRPQGVVFRNNIILNGDGVVDEQKTPGAVAYADYNLLVNEGVDYKGVVMLDRQPGDDGFGKHDIRAKPGSVIKQEGVGYPFPFSDEDLFSGRESVASVMAFYRHAYQLRDGSPAIDSGAPADGSDPAVNDGHVDIGAIEFTKAPRESAARPEKPRELSVNAGAYSE